MAVELPRSMPVAGPSSEQETKAATLVESTGPRNRSDHKRLVSCHAPRARKRLAASCSSSGLFVKPVIDLNLRCPSFQEENEIPASVFVKEPAPGPAEGKEGPAEENQSLEETLHTVDLSSDDESAHDEEALQDSSEETLEESRAEKIKRSSLRKVDSLKKAFSRQNIEKKMNKLGTKIVSVERREKIKKSLASNHQKVSSGKRSPFKVSPLTFVRKKVREGESPAENESRWGDTPSSDQVAEEQEQSSLAKGLSQTSLASAPAEGKSEGGEAGRPASSGANAGLEGSAELTAREDEEEESVALEQAQKVRYEGGYLLASGGAERSDEEPEQPAVLQVDQSA
nr:caveolae-associated protein 2 [Vulpes vulpes]